MSRRDFLLEQILLTFQQAAAMLAISLRQFRRLIDSGRISVVRVSYRAPRVRLTDIEAFIASNTVIHSLPEIP